MARTAARVSNIILGNPDLVVAPQSAFGELTDYEEDASEHWRGSLTGGLHSLSLTPNSGARGLRSITLDTPGSGYTTASVSFTGGGGTGGGTARAILSGGAITAFQILTPGDYDSAPTVVITGDGTGGAGTAVLDGRGSISSGILTMLGGGVNGYKLPFKDAAVCTFVAVLKFDAFVSPKGQVLFGNALSGSTAGTRWYVTNGGNMSAITYGGTLQPVTGREGLIADDAYFAACSKNNGITTNYLGGAVPSIVNAAYSVADQFWGVGNTGFGASNVDYGKGIRCAEVIFYAGRALSIGELGGLYRRTQARLADDGITVR